MGNQIKRIQKPRGTFEVLPNEVYKWQYIEKIIREICVVYGFSEIRIPTFEATELFSRGVGETTDIVQKEMYTFTDRENRSFTLRPEGTAGVMRSVIENSLHADSLPLRIFYILNCFRYEKPQAGRSREFFQFGVEQMGTASPASDAEVIALAFNLFKRLGIKDTSLNINTIGCRDCRPAYHSALKDYLKDNFDKLCDTCKDRFNINPMRILDCKSPICTEIVAQAPKSKDHLCVSCGEHFDSVQAHLSALGMDFNINPLIVRGLDYYTKTVFEFIAENIGAQSTVCGGGRYDGLSELIGGSPLPGIGFGMGLSRIILAMEASECNFGEVSRPAVYIAALAGASEKALELTDSLRKAGVYALTDVAGRSLKAQMKYSDKIQAQYTYIIGEEELKNGSAVLKNMETSAQSECRFEDLYRVIGNDIQRKE